MVDEADRLLRQAYQDWLPFVVAAAGSHGGPLQQPGLSGRRVLKFVASATLTRDPAKIERLGLHCPRYLALEAADTRCISFTSPSKASAPHLALYVGWVLLPPHNSCQLYGNSCEQLQAGYRIVWAIMGSIVPYAKSHHRVCLEQLIAQTLIGDA